VPIALASKAKMEPRREPSFSGPKNLSRILFGGDDAYMSYLSISLVSLAETIDDVIDDVTDGYYSIIFNLLSFFNYYWKKIFGDVINGN
jgi:hypothetical protein